MKTCIKNVFLLPVLTAAVGLILAGRGTAQTFTTLHSFNQDTDGNHPNGLLLSSNTLYGTATYGGSSPYYGMVFAVNTDGTGFTNLHSFTFSDGSDPVGGLILSGIALYGVTGYGGCGGNGTVFALSTNGMGFTTLYSFTGPPWNGSPSPITNTDGAHPEAGLVLSGSTLYGTAEYGSSSGNGTVFAVNTDGTGFTNLYSFTALFGPHPQTNSDGACPSAGSGLFLSGNTLYGTAENGGISGNGTVFAVNTDGTGFTTLDTFTATSITPFGVYTNSDGANPAAGLILSGNTLYGTAQYGGSSSVGTVFSLSLPVPPKLTIIRSGANVILTWPTNATGFTLLTTTNLVSPVWITNSPLPVIVNGQNIVTNAISGTQKFYRLSQ